MPDEHVKLRDYISRGPIQAGTNITIEGEWRGSVIGRGVKINADSAGSDWYASGGIYLMSAMNWYDNTKTGLVLLASADGITFSLLAPMKFYSPDSYVKEPNILFHDDLYWLTWSSVAVSATVFKVAKSTDLMTWTAVASVDMTAISGVQHVWAPEWFKDSDGSIHVFVTCNAQASLTANFKIYEVHPTNADMTAWSAPVEVTGTGFPTSIIDVFPIKLGNNYYLWYKDNVEEVIEYATSTSLTSGYTIVQSGNWAGFGTKMEGPHLVELPNGNWRLYMQNYTSIPGEYIAYSDSADDWATWSAPARVVGAWRLMHGGVDRFTDLDTVQRILSIYQSQLNGGRWYSSEGNVMLVLNAGVNTKTGNQAASYELWLNSVQKWEMRTDEATSGTPLEFETAGTAVVAIQTAGELDILTAGRTIRFLGTAGGDSEGIQYKDSGGTGRFGLVFPGSNVVALANRASNGVVQIRANTSAAAEAGEKTIAEFQDDKIVIGDATAGVDYIITINGETNDLTLTWMEDENYLKTNAVIRGATSLYRRYYHIPLAAVNPGASGATWTAPSANTVGGWQLDSATEVLYANTDIHSDWDGASDITLEMAFEVNVNNTGGGVGDTVDIKAVVYYKGETETACKSQTVEVATVVGQSAQYKQFKANFPIDWDAASNVVEAGDRIRMIINLETDTSEVDNIIINDASISYQTTHIGVESGDV